MVKKHLNLFIETDLTEKAKAQGLVISKFLENKLQEYFEFIDSVSKVPDNKALRGRFELPLPLRRTGSQGRRGGPSFATSAVFSLLQWYTIILIKKGCPMILEQSQYARRQGPEFSSVAATHGH